MFAYVHCYGKLESEMGQGAEFSHFEWSYESTDAPPEVDVGDSNYRTSAVLNTGRMRLRPISTGDVDALHTLWTDPDVRRYLWDDRIIPRETVEQIVAQSLATFDADGFGYFALELQDRADELIGFCGHRRADIEGQIELLYGIHPAYWGEGLVAEAAREVLRFGFESCAFDRVIAATDTPNQQSVRVLQKLGMTFQCRREFHGLDTVFYSMTRSEFFETD
jgi:ribosomal-protein-alanine N-acetyltransferase